MTVWLYDACGPERRVRGVTDDEGRARRLARESLRSVDASTALVEQALTALDATTLINGYVRTGQGWQARLTPRGRIAWKRLTVVVTVDPAAKSQAPSKRRRGGGNRGPALGGGADPPVRRGAGGA
jgi:hypothetical protein